MTMIYDPNSFDMLVQKILVGNHEPIMRICRKILTINLHNLQMLFMLWIKNKFSECLGPLHKHEGPQWKTFCDVAAQARRHGEHSGQLPLQCFLCPPNFVLLRKICFNHMIKMLIFLP